MKKLCLIVVCLPILFMMGCGGNSLIGSWISDYDSTNRIVFRKDTTLTVTTGADRVSIDGIYEIDGEHLTIKLFADGFTDSITVTYEIEKNKLRLIRSDGQIEQFSRK